MRILLASDYRRMPWKNGGGETIEIAVSPPAASISDFDWRVSMARVLHDGPFSAFPGVDRTLSILDGKGISLTVGDASPLTLTGDSAPYEFAADVATSAALLAGPVLDFNVMSRRDRFAHRVRRLDLSNSVELALSGSEQLIFSTRGATVMSIGSSTIDLEEGETLHRSGPAAMTTLRSTIPSTVFVVEISPV